MWDGGGAPGLGRMTRTWILFFQRLAKGLGDVASLNDAGGQGSVWTQEQPAGKVDGVNTIFTLSYAPTPGSLDLMLNIRQRENQDYTIDGQTITFAVAPKPTDISSPYYPNGAGWFLARYQH